MQTIFGVIFGVSKKLSTTKIQIELKLIVIFAVNKYVIRSRVRYNFRSNTIKEKCINSIFEENFVQFLEIPNEVRSNIRSYFRTYIQTTIQNNIWTNIWPQLRSNIVSYTWSIIRSKFKINIEIKFAGTFGLPQNTSQKLILIMGFRSKFDK